MTQLKNRTVNFEKNDPFLEPKYTMRSKTSQGIKKDQMLGPGAFNPSYSQVRQSSTKAKFGTSKRQNITQEKNYNPGPGHYSSKKPKKNLFTKFGSSNRTGMGRLSENPGPGAYENTSMFDRHGVLKGAKIGEKLKNLNNSHQLAPNTYHPSLDYIKPKTKGGRYYLSYNKELGARLEVKGQKIIIRDLDSTTHFLPKLSQVGAQEAEIGAI